MNNIPANFFTKQELAQRMRCCERTVDRTIRNLKIQVFKIGKRVLVPESEVRRMFGLEGGDR
jgi:excisionase family DNA binding protein